MPTATPSRIFIILDDSTVREARDRQEEKRPNKRVRVDSDEEDAQDSYGSHNAKGPVERDPVYFKEDELANCVVRVRGWLFKIQADMLSCSPTMNSYLQDHIRRYGMPTEEKPFLCPNPLPTVDEYRAFLWALYATFDELSEPIHTNEELERLSHIITINKKFDIPKMHDWAVEMLHKTANNHVFMQSCSSASLALLVDTAKSNHKKYGKVLDATVKAWCNRVWDKTTPSVPAMQTADKHDLPELVGTAYYVHVQDMHDRQTSFTERGAAKIRVDLKLNNGQVMRLLTGYWSLVSLWERHRVKPLELPKGKSCSDKKHIECMANWNRRWISAVGWRRILDLSSADILGLLECLRDQLLNDDDLKAALEPECRLAGLEAIRALRTKTKEGLADHFFACV
ncbi:hypothetical protein BDN70DRAFT_876715 [Pholiota conissans]|uniref:BTB domain-containing protein n=1 Tax=Pholiota conissans TaxID=109636 RepID=A0A9P5Z472_9AGAR|nr:hypothetical protein BDN70DRAFT_876715 [Pholiota conissans]